jgi:L-ribulokinase
MQIYADITNREIKVSASGQTAALGAAMYASVAAGTARGGYGRIEDAALAMSRMKEETYKPDPENAKIYSVLYGYYRELSAYLGEKSGIMRGLKALV